MTLRTTPVGDWSMNAYALVCPQTNHSVLIDPGADPEKLASLVAGTIPVAIAITHTHPDHIDALEAMRARLNVPVYAAAAPHFNDVSIHTDHVLRAADTFYIGNYALRVYETPGHCIDQLAFEVVGTPTMIVGDATFAGGPGRTSSNENFKILLRTVRDVVLNWSDGTVCYPGHGPAFALAEKRKAISAFVARDHGDFFGDAEW